MAEYRAPPSARVLVKLDDGAIHWDADDAAVSDFMATMRGRFPDFRVEAALKLRPETLRELGRRARRTDPGYASTAPSLFAWLRLVGATPEAAEREAVRLGRVADVRTAYVERPAAPSPTGQAWPAKWFAAQTYREAAPVGIGANVVQSRVPLGTGVGFADVERGWWLEKHQDGLLFGHPDHPRSPVSVDHNDGSDAPHGTAVIGIVLAGRTEGVALDADEGCVGIAHGATLKGLFGIGAHNVATSVLHAVDVLAFGDVLLLEAQAYGKDSYLPAEAESLTFDAVRLATAAGIVVVAAAGNGGVDLRFAQTLEDTWPFALGHPDYRDSGAVLVAAGRREGLGWRALRHDGKRTTNVGLRIDCFASGDAVQTTRFVTAADGNHATLDGFGDTSAAAAIVGGAALAVQGLARSAPGGPRVLAPGQVRHLLRTHGTAGEAGIGAMPDLATIEAKLHGLPDLYLRDTELDDGSVHPGVGRTFQSPDILPVDPGPGLAVSSVLVRAWNRGAGAATDVVATLYRSAASSLVTGDHLARVGQQVSAAVVPPGDEPSLLAVKLDSALALGGAEALVAVVHAPTDPAPPMDALRHFSNFVQYVQTANNLAWRCVATVPATPGGPYTLTCLVRGPADRAASMRVEVRVRPPTAVTALGLEPTLVEALGVLNPEGGDTVTLYPPPSGDWYVVGEGKLYAGFEEPLNIDVVSSSGGTVEVRQVHEGIEVGRFRWDLSPA